MDENRIIITYETIFELLRREKEREALQKLEKTFFQDILDYLKEKKKIMISQESMLISPEEKKKNEKQLENIKKLLKEFYERREKKIINLAIDKVRVGSDLIDTSSLLEEEKRFFQRLINLLSESRTNVLDRLLNLEMPKLDEEKTEKKEEIVGKENVRPEEKSSVMVRFIHAVPKFIGKELEEYGPFEEEEMANLPREIAEVLIGKERAEEIKEN